ncbi:MAG: ankyrin repeat domain-containing protein [Bacteroidota bacterium]
MKSKVLWTVFAVMLFSVQLRAPFIEDLSLLHYFIKAGASFNSTDTYGNGIFNYASKGGNTWVLDQLIELGAAVNIKTTNDSNAMIMANRGTRGKVNTLEAFKYLELIGVKPNTVTKSGFTPLHALSFKNKDLTIFRYFLDQGVDVNQKDENGNTALLNMTKSNDLASIRFLVEEGALVNEVNDKGESALMLAVKQNDVEAVEFLIEEGAKIDDLDVNGNSLVYYLLASFNYDNSESFDAKLELLLKNGIDLQQIQAGGNSLYHLAAKQNNMELFKKLSKHAPPGNTKNEDGLTALHIAAMKASSTDILEYLLTLGGDKSIKTDFDETVYDLASENELLLKNNAQIEFLQ